MPLNAVFLAICFCLVCPFQAFSQGGKYIYQEPLSYKVNSPFDELYPVISPDGRLIFYTIRFHPKNIGGELDPGDIWISELKQNGEWSNPENAGDLWNDKGYNILFKFFDSNRKALLSNQNESNASTVAISNLQEGEWSKPAPLKIQSFYNRSGHLSATISEDSEVLILSMESYGSAGYEDLYVSFRENDSLYSQPINLGEVINTNFQEMTPHLSDDGLTLYFASNGHGGYGGRDIFASERLDDTWLNWTRPMNLGPGVNTVGIELSFYQIDQQPVAYVSSTQNSRGMGDIFKMNITDSPLQVVATNTKEPSIIRPLQEEKISGVEIKEDVKSEIEKAKTNIVFVDMMKTEKTENENKREEFRGKRLTNSKTLNKDEGISIPNLSNHNLSAVSIENSVKKVTGRIVSSNNNQALQAIIQFANNEMIATDAEGNFELLITDKQIRNGWITADGMKPMAIALNANQLFPEFYLSEVGSFRMIVNSSKLVELPTDKGSNPEKVSIINTLMTPKLRWTIQDEETNEEMEVSWRWLVKNEVKESGKTEMDGVIIVAGSGLLSSRLFLEAPGYTSQDVVIQNDLLSDQIFYLQKGISGNSFLQNQDFITSIFEPNLQGKVINQYVSILLSKNPYTISVSDENGVAVASLKISQTENWKEAPKIDINSGIASFALSDPNKPNKFKVISAGYFPMTVQAAEWEIGNHLEASLEKIELGSEFILSTLEFEQSTISFTDSTVIEELDRLADMLLNTVGLEILLTGYTDNQGLARENMELSAERATAVKTYLQAKGIESFRIEAKGLGSANPIASNQSPETRKLNRRVEVTVVKITE